MPESYAIDRRRELVVSRAWKTLTDVELRAHYDRLEADPSFEPYYRQLIDVRDVDEFALTTAVMLGTALRHVFRSGVPRAVVVANDAQLRTAQLFAAYAEADGQIVQVFLDEGRASEWLAL